MKEILKVNEKLGRFVYPYFFLSLVVGFWFGGIGGDITGEELVSFVINELPNTQLIFGIPVIIIAVIIIIILSFFGTRIGKWDFNIMYGRILKKLESLLAEMEELRS